MSRYDVRTGSDGRIFVPLEESNVDRYSHLSKHQRNTKSRTQFYTEKRENLCSIISVFISLVSILSSAVLFYLFTTKSVQLADNFCVPCNKIKFSPYPNENEKYKRLEKDYENKVEVCCASTPQTTEDLLYLISERKLRDSEAEERNAQIRDGYFKGSIISGHVLMSGYDTDKKPGPPVKLLDYRKLSHLHGLNITHNRLIIATKGKYYLYSQMYFKVILEANTKKSDNVLSHCIKRYNSKLPNSGSEVLLDSRFTVNLQAGLKDDHDFSSKFISGIFELEAGDQLYVEVTDATFVSRIPEHNFIGLFLLG